jgi:hypothetical protein
VSSISKALPGVKDAVVPDVVNISEAVNCGRKESERTVDAKVRIACMLLN